MSAERRGPVRATFRDITLGGTALYDAQPGWDDPTGWAAPRAMKPADALPESLDLGRRAELSGASRASNADLVCRSAAEPARGHGRTSAGIAVRAPLRHDGGMRRLSLSIVLVLGCGDPAGTTGETTGGTTGASTGEPTPTTGAAGVCGFEVTASAAWPAADALFHSDPRWLGADDAYSIALAEDRVLWLFGDTFIATSEAHVRGESRMIHNSVAIQSGLDPASASIDFAWREAGEPGSFFPEEDDLWFWPGDGERVGDGLVIFLMAVHPVEGGFGFEVVGSDAVWIADPNAPLDTWKPVTIGRFREPDQVPGSASVLVEDGFLYAFTAVPGGAALLRWPVAAVGPQPLPAPELLMPQPVLTGTQVEFTVHHDLAREQYVQLQSEGFGGTDLAYRTAPALTGPWSAATKFHRPPESDAPDAFVYAGKAHPELAGADLVVTYVANSFEFTDLFSDPTLYYPRFVRVTLGCAE